MSFMTKLAGVPDTDEAKSGMAFFEGTGPQGKFCGDCKFRGLIRQSQKSTYNEAAQQFIHKNYRTTQCQKYKSIAGGIMEALLKRIIRPANTSSKSPNEG